MAAIHGTNTRIYFNAFDVTSYLRNANINATRDVADTTMFGQGAHTYIGGQGTRTHAFEGRYDAAINTMRASLGVESGVLTHCPGGASAIGDLAWLSSAIGTTYDESSPIADIVAFSWDVTPSGPIAFGYVLHPLAEDTNTTTGATQDDSAATTTGWTGHLHVTAVDAGTWTIALEDSANGSTWASVSGGSFTAATGATQQRLVSAAGATLRRYVRYTATRAGGAGGDGITFLLAISRTYVV